MKSIFFKVLDLFKNVNINTIRFNFTYLPFSQAIKFPIYVSSRFLSVNMNGSIKIEGEINRGMICIGFGKIGIFDYKNTNAVWDVKGNVIFKGTAFLGQGTKISVGKNGQLTFGEKFYMPAESSIVAHKSIVFGENSFISWDVLVMDTDFHRMVDSKNYHINPNKDIIIGKNVWIGCRSTILKGSNIADGVVVAANSLVSGSLSETNCVYGGNPAKKLKDNISWER